MAIDFGHFTDANFQSGTPIQWNHNTTGDSIVFAVFTSFSGGISSSLGPVTCGGVSMTKLASASTIHVLNNMDVWYCFSPPQGVSTQISATSNSGTWLLWSASYSGVGTFGATDTGSEQPQAGGHLQFPITTLASGSWVFMALQEQTQSIQTGDGANTFARGHIAGFAGCGVSDSGLIAGAGAQSLDITNSVTGYVMAVMAELQLPVAPPTGPAQIIFRNRLYA